METGNDRRVRRTKKSIRQALTSLLREKSLQNITVKEIADRADINRGTFYTYYHDVYDIVEQLKNEMFEQLCEVAEHATPADIMNNPLDILTKAFEFFAEQSDMFIVMFGENCDTQFVNKLMDVCMEKCINTWRELWHVQYSHVFEYCSSYFIWGCIGILRSWLDGGMKETPEEMAALITTMVTSGSELLKPDNILAGANCFVKKD